jgi:hypothetical protein
MLPCVGLLQAVRGFGRLQFVAAALGTFCLMGMSAAIGRGLAPSSLAPMAFAAGTRWNSQLASLSIRKPCPAPS